MGRPGGAPVRRQFKPRLSEEQRAPILRSIFTAFSTNGLFNVKQVVKAIALLLASASNVRAEGSYWWAFAFFSPERRVRCL